MRSRAIEIASAVVGVAIVGVLALPQLNERERPSEPGITGLASTEETPRAAERAGLAKPLAGHEHPAEVAARRLEAAEGADPSAARRDWQAASAEVARVVTELERVDVRLDTLEAEFLRREASGEEDPEALERELRSRLKELVEVYNQLERELVTLEGAEQAAAAHLEAAEGARAAGPS